VALTFGGKRRKPGGGPPAQPLTPTENRLVNRLVTVMNLLSSTLDTDAYAAAIANLDPDLLERLLADINIDQLSRLLEDTMRSVVLSGGTAEAREIIRNAPRVGQNPFLSLEYDGRVLPSGIIMPGPTLPEIPDVEFVIESPVERSFKFINQKATDYARTRSAQLVTAIDQSNRLAIRETISQAFTTPRTVDQTARSLRQIVGLHPRWARAVERFNDKNFRRLIRDGFDTDKAQATADSMTEKYRRKLIRRRAEMIARTEIQQAQNFGREASWQATERAGLIDPRAEKEWRTAPLGSRYGPPCPECTEMRGTRVPWNGTFANGRSMPPAHPNCRCTAVIVPPSRGLTGLPSQNMDSWIAELDRLEAEDMAKSAVVIKHLQGKHDQKTHGRGGMSDVDASAARIADTARTGAPSGIRKRDLVAIQQNPAAFGFEANEFTRAEQRRNGLMPNDEATVEALKKTVIEGYMIREQREWRQEEAAGRLSETQKDDLVDYFETIRNKGTVFVATDARDAASILDKGEFETVFETNRSNGAVAHDARRREEFASHDLHPNLDPNLRPVYGYVAFNNPVMMGADGYGNVRFELKPETKERATMTDGDSLGSYATPIPMSGDPITRKQAIAGSMGWNNLSDQGQSVVRGEEAIIKRVDSERLPGRYIEAQVKGGVKIDDVARIHVTGGYPSDIEALVEAAEARDIEIVYHG
jgi:hypothetical protein